MFTTNTFQSTLNSASCTTEMHISIQQLNAYVIECRGADSLTGGSSLEEPLEEIAVESKEWL